MKTPKGHREISKNNTKQLISETRRERKGEAKEGDYQSIRNHKRPVRARQQKNHRTTKVTGTGIPLAFLRCADVDMQQKI